MTIVLNDAIKQIAGPMRIFDMQRFDQSRRADASELEILINDTSIIRQQLRSADYAWSSGYLDLQSQIRELGVIDKARYAEFLLMLSGSNLRSALVHQIGPAGVQESCNVALKLSRIATSVIKEIMSEYPEINQDTPPYSNLLSRDERFQVAYAHRGNCPSEDEFESALVSFEVKNFSDYCKALEEGTEKEKIAQRIPDLIVGRLAPKSEVDFIKAAANLAILSEFYSIQSPDEPVPITLVELAEAFDASAEEQLYRFQKLVGHRMSAGN